MQRIGTRFAQFALVTCITSMTGCLVTDQIDLPPPINHRPSIVDQASARNPSTGIIELEFDDDGPTEVFLDVTFRDANIFERLEYRVFIDNETNTDIPVVSGRTDDPTTSAAEPTEDRDVSIAVPTTRLRTPRCHRIDLYVSSEFDDITRPTTPATAGDIGHIAWWVRSTDESSTEDVGMQTCPLAPTP